MDALPEGPGREGGGAAGAARTEATGTVRSRAARPSCATARAGAAAGRSTGGHLRTAVRILRGGHRGREGWISGTLEDRATSGITKALVKFADGAEPQMLAVSSLVAIDQLDLFSNAKTTAAGAKAGGGVVAQQIVTAPEEALISRS